MSTDSSDRTERSAAAEPTERSGGSDGGARPPAHPASRHALLRRIGGGIVALAIGLGAVILLLLWFNSRDDAHVDPAGTTAVSAPGQPFATPEQLLRADQVRLLRLGDVYVIYGGPSRRAPAALSALQERLSGPPDPALERAGQAVILVRDPDAGGVVALGGDRIVRVSDPTDPELEEFASYWLGQTPSG